MKEYYLIFNNNSILDALSVITTRNPHWTESPLDGIPTGRNPHQNFMYQWVFRTVGIPGI